METWKKWLADKQVKGKELLKASGACVLKQFCDRVVYPAFVPLWDRPYGEELKRIHGAIAAMQQKTVISVIMPVYRIEVRYLKRAVESVRKQIYPYWELCIADDASHDPRITRYLKQVAAEDQRIHVVFREQRGHICAASNTALALATGDYVAMLDHDDQLHPLALFHVARAIEARPDAEVLYTARDRLTSWLSCRFSPVKCYKGMVLVKILEGYGNPICHLNVFRKKSLLALNGYREGFEGSQDYDLLLRFLYHFGISVFYYIPYVLYHWGIVKSSVSFNREIKAYTLLSTDRSHSDYMFKKNRSSKPSVRLADMLIILRSCASSTAWERKICIQKYFPFFSLREKLDLQSIEKNNQVKYSLNKIKESSCPYIFWFDVNQFCYTNNEDILSYINNLVLFLHSSESVGVSSIILSEKIELYHAGFTVQSGYVLPIVNYLTRDDLNWFTYYYNTNHIPISAAGTWCFLARRDVFLEMGGYDTTIEDIETAHVDWCLRCTVQEKREIKIDFNNPCFYPHAFTKPQINQELLRKKHNLDKAVQHVNLHPGLKRPPRKFLLPECVWPRHRPWHIEP